MKENLKFAAAIALIVSGLMLIVHAGVKHSISDLFDWFPRLSAPIFAFLGAFFGVLFVVAVVAIEIVIDMHRVRRRIYGKHK